MAYPSTHHKPRLAWHETLELHELVAMETNHLITLKKSVKKVSDPALKNLYMMAIGCCQQHLQQLLRFYPHAAMALGVGKHEHAGTGYYAGSLLGMSKTAVRTYAAAITETATPLLRHVLCQQLYNNIQLHAHTFNYMHQRGYYPAYDLNKLLNHDVHNAQKALAMGI